MEGLRILGAVRDDGRVGKAEWNPWFRFKVSASMGSRIIPVPVFPCAIAQLRPNPRGPGAEYCFSKAVHGSLLADFFEHGYSSTDPLPTASKGSQHASTHTGVKIAVIQSDVPPNDKELDAFSRNIDRRLIVNIEPEDFACTWKALNAHPRLGKMMTWGFLRDFEFLGRTADNEGISGYLYVNTSHGGYVRFIWSVRQQGQSSEFDARCIILSQSQVSHSVDKLDWSLPLGHGFLGNNFWKNMFHWDLERSTTTLEQVMAHLKAFKLDSHSPLYLPFAISVFALEQYRGRISEINDQVEGLIDSDRGDEWWAGSHETGPNEEQRQLMFCIVEERIPLKLEMVERELNSIESLWDYLVIMAKKLPDTAKSDDVCRGNESILAALYYLRQELSGLREVMRSLAVQTNSVVSMRSQCLNQKDADGNLKMAKITHELAQAARQDSSAMKTIAVLTMAFLPATFLATLLSMPSLNWDQRKHFVIYWILAIPITVATFVLWALVTQRQQVRKWLKDVHASLRRRNRARKEQKQRKRKEMERQRATNDEAPGKV